MAARSSRAICDGKVLDIVSAFQSYGEFIAGRITDEERERDRALQHPGAGACGGMYTANTMASAIEALGMSLPVQRVESGRGRRQGSTNVAGRARRSACSWSSDIKPRDIMTRRAFENAMVVVMALGGSTNAVLHLIAMARSVEVPLSIDDFQKVSDRVPLHRRSQAERQIRPGRFAQRRRHAGA